MKGQEMMTLKYGPKLVSAAYKSLDAVFTTELSNLNKTAALITQNISAKGVLHIFGAGHSHLFCEEICYRAGGLVPAPGSPLQGWIG